MDPINVDIRLIKAVLGTELRIAPGRALMARVVTADGLGRGSLNIAGAVIDATLPKDIQAGQELRLTVAHVSPDRVELSLSGQDPATLAAAASEAVPLPGGGTVQVAERDAGGGGGASGSQGTDRHALASATTPPRSARSTCASSLIRRPFGCRRRSRPASRSTSRSTAPASSVTRWRTRSGGP